MIKAVIFDMDGVIVDTEPLNDVHMHRHFKKIGLNVPHNYFEWSRGITSWEFWEKVAKEFKLEKSVKQLVTEARTSFLEFLSSQKVEPIKGVAGLLKMLQKNKINIALASSGSKKRIGMTLKLCKLTHYFSVIVSADDVTRGKPDPEIYLKTAKLLKIAPKDCVVIEDAVNGILSAKAAGIRVIGFKTSEYHKQDLSKADKIVNSLSKITMSMLKSL